MNLSFANSNTISDAGKTWSAVVAAAPNAWVWATHEVHQFRLSVLNSSARLVSDESFFLKRGDKVCGLAPLVLIRDEDSDAVLASYGGTGLPWPMLTAEASNLDEAETALLDELERRVKSAGAAMISLMLAPPLVSNEMRDKFMRTVRDRCFVDTSFQSHTLSVSEATPPMVRERYRRYVRKFGPKYDIKILDASNIPENMASEYMALHTKDAGGVFRPLETYERQVDLARQGEGFWVVARNKAADRNVGMLFVDVFKDSAYDSTVAVDPDFQDEQVSHLLKWVALHHLIGRGVKHYELGQAALSPSYLWQPTPKNYGISFFKDGWSRGELKTVHAAEKFYSPAYLRQSWSRKLANLSAHFSLADE